MPLILRIETWLSSHDKRRVVGMYSNPASAAGFRPGPGPVRYGSSSRCLQTRWPRAFPDQRVRCSAVRLNQRPGKPRVRQAVLELLADLFSPVQRRPWRQHSANDGVDLDDMQIAGFLTVSDRTRRWFSDLVAKTAKSASASVKWAETQFRMVSPRTRNEPRWESNVHGACIAAPPDRPAIAAGRCGRDRIWKVIGACSFHRAEP